MMAPGAAATDDDDGGGPSSPVLVEGNSGHSGTPLKEHDYIGLSVSASSSSSFQSMQQNSSSPASRGHCEKKVARRSGEEEEEFNLNLGATELRLGPTSLLQQQQKKIPEISCRAASNGPPRNMFPLSKNGVGGAKRGFSEALGNTVPPPPMESRNGSSPLYGSDGRNNGFVEGGGGALREGSSVGNNKGRSNNEMSPQQSKHHLGAPALPATAATTTMQSQMVGWPPVRNFRKTLVQQQPPRPAPPQERQPRPTTTTPQVTTTLVPLTAAAAAAPASNGTQVTQTSFLVKVYMDGLSIGRKVDLTVNNSYERLKSALEDMFQDMFQQFISKTGMFSSCSQKLNFLHSSEYVLTYEDRESDLMLVGDVPWEMFTTIVRRLRIMKGVDIARRGGGDNPTNSQVEAV
ncbi:unnamed protein product [Sphagnum troendelagicum]|uniref:Auxin-responsive protein n=1 Tax=Sphagnum troendelagicum TaxID=128251 RepID=A0ABP0U369_9BRYO